MNILYVSKLWGNLWAGPNNSVPAQIRAQSKYDNVFWLNYNNVKRDEWTKNGLDCRNLDDFPSGRLENLPAPFNSPDLVVFEEFYNHAFSKIVADVTKAKIPYVIVPRCELTKLAQKKKPLKKIIGNILFFNKFARNASAIQFLTESEKNESGKKWNKNPIVIPNGVDITITEPHFFHKNEIRASYVGRVECYQKGLDLLIDAIIELKDELLKKKFTLSIYGPDRFGSLDILQKRVRDAGAENVVQFCEAVFGQQKRDVLLNTDVFIMTSRFEGLPMGMIEALAYGIPCVATTGTNMSKQIFDADAGWSALGDKASIKEVLLQLCSANDFSKKGSNALQLAQKYSWDSIAMNTHDEYKKF